MRGCSSCGQDNPAGFRFCGACGSPLVDATRPPAGEERKVSWPPGHVPAGREWPGRRAGAAPAWARRRGDHWRSRRTESGVRPLRGVAPR
ncbi:MAG: DUF7577 domain-containing protein, partial [Actinomycetota bacterium]